MADTTGTFISAGVIGARDHSGLDLQDHERRAKEDEPNRLLLLLSLFSPDFQNVFFLLFFLGRKNCEIPQ